MNSANPSHNIIRDLPKRVVTNRNGIHLLQPRLMKNKGIIQLDIKDHQDENWKTVHYFPDNEWTQWTTHLCPRISIFSNLDLRIILTLPRELEHNTEVDNMKILYDAENIINPQMAFLADSTVTVQWETNTNPSTHNIDQSTTLTLDKDANTIMFQDVRASKYIRITCQAKDSIVENISYMVAMRESDIEGLGKGEAKHPRKMCLQETDQMKDPGRTEKSWWRSEAKAVSEKDWWRSEAKSVS